LNVTLDLATGLVGAASIATGWLVYRWTAPPQADPELAATTLSNAQHHSKGERLVAALTAAVAVMMLGAYLLDGIKDVKRTRDTDHKQEKAVVEPYTQVGHSSSRQEFHA
jgi:hypothetical protein